MTLLAEDLLLLALDDDKGTVSWGQSTSLPLVLAGGVIADLALLERVRVEGKNLVVRDAAATGDDLLDDAVTAIASSKKPHDPKHWVNKLAGRSFHLHDRLIARLVSRGILREEEHKILWVFPDDRYPAVETAGEQATRDQLRAVVLTGADPDPRTAVLLSLLKAGSMEKRVFSSDEWKAAKTRVEELTETEAISKAVGQAIADATAAVIAASTAAIVASTAASASSH
jgi:hypothetical protein